MRLHHAAFSRPHVFILSWPRTEIMRMEAERLLRARGWPLSLSPADTDVLLVLTPDGALSGEAAVISQRFFFQMPQPAVRSAASAVGDLPVVLERAHRQITMGSAVAHPATVEATDTHSAVSAERDVPLSTDTLAAAGGGGRAQHHMHDNSVDGVAGQGGQAGTADTAESMVMTGDMMMDPGGLPLAGEAADRDGLSLDVLHLGLGPALPWWPAGLQVQVTLQGDVISAAKVRIITADTSSGAHPPAATSARLAALDGLSRLLFLVGDDRHACSAVRLRDDLLVGAVSGAALSRLATRIRRSKLLRSMLQRIPLAVGDGGDATGPMRDVWSCVVALLQMLDGADQQTGGELADVDSLPGVLIGRELAEARLIIAALTSPVLHPASIGHR